MEEMLILLKPDGMVRRYAGARALKIQEYEIHGKVKKDYNKSDSHYK